MQTTLHIKSWAMLTEKSLVKKFFQTDTLPILDITKEQLETLARETVNEGLTVPGVQKKLSLHLSKELQNRLTMVDYPTGYIFITTHKTLLVLLY